MTRTVTECVEVLTRLKGSSERAERGVISAFKLKQLSTFHTVTLSVQYFIELVLQDLFNFMMVLFFFIVFCFSDHLIL